MNDAINEFPRIAKAYFESCFPRIKNALDVDFSLDMTARDRAQHALASMEPAARKKRARDLDRST
nr:hypothetical protein [Candidatus Sigynarchaeota archaeon]